MPTRKNVKVSERIKMVLQALLIWFVIIIFLPIVLIVLIFGKIFKKDITFFKKIKVRL
jgi:ABC-type sulfate transport system permease component